jgi:hypothetical protein
MKTIKPRIAWLRSRASHTWYGCVYESVYWLPRVRPTQSPERHVSEASTFLQSPHGCQMLWLMASCVPALQFVGDWFFSERTNHVGLTLIGSTAPRPHGRSAPPNYDSSQSDFALKACGMSFLWIGSSSLFPF